MASKSYVNGAIILMVAGFIVRILGFVYRIYLSNLLGAEGMGVFQLISPVYSLLILTLTSGVSVAVSKTVASELAKNHIVNLRRITSCALAMTSAAGLAVSLFLYLQIDFVANVILKDSRTYYSLLLLLPCIPVIAAAAAIKGYFYGIQEVTPTAVSQIVEQVIRIGLVMVMADYFLKLGLEYACALATFGMAVGEISNLSVVLGVYLFKKKKSGKSLQKKGLLRKRKIFTELLSISLPISANRFITSSMSAVEYILIPRRLLEGGLNYMQSIEMYGRLTGMAMPLIYFPCLVTSSLATTLVPAISEAVSLKRDRTVHYRISKSIQITFILGFIFTGVFMAYSEQIGEVVYRGQKVGSMLYSLSFTCIFIYLHQTLLGILNGLGKQGISLRNSILGYVIRIAFVYYLVPIYGVESYITGVIISTAFVCIMDLITVVKTTGLTVDVRSWILKPGIVGAFMLLTGKYIYSFFEIFIVSSRLLTIAAVGGNIGIAVVLMTILGVLDKRDISKTFGIKKAK